ncbi:MAG: 8-amino-7-oxononanoate synthase [Planctomycetes bacterium]|nr:8-amino-7-oxononanoate synthase [Planctomycetota bacterium]
MSVWVKMQADLAMLERRGLRRHGFIVESPIEPRVTVAGVRMVCLCSNNYLNLANHPEVRSAAAKAIAQWGVGVGASRLISGTTSLHIQLQDALAALRGTEAALVTSTGYAANACAMSTLAAAGDLIMADKLSHASVIDAARGTGAVLRTYHHNDMDRLRALLTRLRPNHKRCVLVTDGLFSMDGDVAPLIELVEIRKQFDAVLVVDDSHAFGVLGEGGRGSAEAAGVADEVDVTIGTLSKALGAMGGFIAGRRVLIDMIWNTARPFIYTTALPPVMCAAALAAMEIVRREPQRRQNCLRNADRLRQALIQAGAHIGGSTTQIIPIILGTAQRALEMSQRCFKAGFLAPAIRPPTVAPNTARLRVSVMAEHEWNDLKRFVDLVAAAKA